MYAEFSTELTAKGTKEEYLKILETLHYYVDERGEQYRTSKNCWFLEMGSEKIGEVSESKLDQFVKNGVFSISLEGPYGVWEGTVIEGTDLFERLADAVPSCEFEGVITGGDSYSDQEIKAKLKNGLLYITSFYGDFGDPDEDDDEDEESSEDENITKSTIYDPIKHEYKAPQKEDCTDKIFVITGKLKLFENRDEFAEYIEDLGGKVVGSISSKTDFLICNDASSTSSKTKKAKELGIPVITEEEFIRRFGDPEEFDLDDEAEEDE